MKVLFKTVSRVSGSSFEQIILVSSAKRIKSRELEHFGRSLMYNKNSKGPRSSLGELHNGSYLWLNWFCHKQQIGVYLSDSFWSNRLKFLGYRND